VSIEASVREFHLRVKYQGRRAKFNDIHDEHGRFGSGDGPDSVARAESSLHEKLPGAVVDFTGLQPPIARAIADRVSGLAEKYPEAASTLRFVGTGLGDAKKCGNIAGFSIAGPDIQSLKDENTIAVTINSTDVGVGMHADQAMLINEKQFQDGLVSAASVRDEQVGWVPPGCDSNLSRIDHEYGHVVCNYLLDDGKGHTPSASSTKDVGKMTVDFLERNANLGMQVSGYARSSVNQAGYEEGPTRLAYLGEPFAEAFSSRIGTPKSAWSEYTIKTDRLLGRVLPGGSSRKWGTA